MKWLDCPLIFFAKFAEFMRPRDEKFSSRRKMQKLSYIYANYGIDFLRQNE